MPRERRMWYWISARDPDTGRPYLIFGGADESECRQKGIEMLSGVDFSIHQYPTRQLSEASAFHRGKRLEKGEGLKASTQRLGHEKSIERLKSQRRRRLGL